MKAHLQARKAKTTPATKTRPANKKNSFDCFSIPFASAMISTMTLPNETVRSQIEAKTDFIDGGACYYVP